MTVVKLAREHLSEVAALERECFSAPWSEKSLQLLLSEEAFGVVCLRDDGRVVAYGGMLWAPDEGQITNIATEPDARRQGYGRAVLEALITAARKRGCEQISLEVRESNTAAIVLYGNCGFVIAGRRKRFYQAPVEDAWVMILTL